MESWWYYFFPQPDSPTCVLIETTRPIVKFPITPHRRNICSVLPPLPPLKRQRTRIRFDDSYLQNFNQFRPNQTLWTMNSHDKCSPGL